MMEYQMKMSSKRNILYKMMQYAFRLASKSRSTYVDSKFFRQI